MVSPGVPFRPAVSWQHARTLGIPVIGEVELAVSLSEGKIVAITGSNGKTTTTTLVGEILEGGRKTLVGGNIGTPVISLAGKAIDGQLACWKYQASNWKPSSTSPPRLPSSSTSRPTISTAITRLRIWPPRRGSSKTSRLPTTGMLNADDPRPRPCSRRSKAGLYWFSRKNPVENGRLLKRRIGLFFVDNGSDTSRWCSAGLTFS